MAILIFEAAALKSEVILQPNHVLKFASQISLISGYFALGDELE